MPSKKTLLERIPSQWRLATMLALFVGTSIALTLVLVRSTVSRDLRRFDSALILDELMEYAAIYESSGLKGVRAIFPAGQSSESHGLRITSASGETLFESVPEDMQVFEWPKTAPSQDWETRKTHLQKITSPKTELVLTVGAYKLRDGQLLWFGRTDAVAQLYQQNITLYLWMAGILAAAVAMLPVIWYSHEVLTPIRAFTASARRLHLPEGTDRLMTPRAIPELKTLASVVNAGLDQILSLTINSPTNCAHRWLASGEIWKRCWIKATTSRPRMPLPAVWRKSTVRRSSCRPSSLCEPEITELCGFIVSRHQCIS